MYIELPKQKNRRKELENNEKYDWLWKSKVGKG